MKIAKKGDMRMQKEVMNVNVAAKESTVIRSNKQPVLCVQQERTTMKFQSKIAKYVVMVPIKIKRVVLRVTIVKSDVIIYHNSMTVCLGNNKH